MVKIRKAFTFIAAFFLMSASLPLFALAVPKLNGRVNDNAAIIRSDDEAEIEAYLANLEATTGIQIAVLTVPSLEGEDIASFGIRVADAWKLGDAEKDNGALLIVALEEHDVRIEVGDGLEGSLTDAKCGLILRNVIIPEFREGDYSEGILKGVQNMGGIAAGDETAVSKSVRENEDTTENDFISLVIILIWFIFVSISIATKVRKGVKRRYRKGSNDAMGVIIATEIAKAVLSSGSGSGGSGHSSGGFHGGGGHFSGGGASGHW